MNKLIKYKGVPSISASFSFNNLPLMVSYPMKLSLSILY